MAIPVIMPRQGQSVETCVITRWYKKKGDTIHLGDILFSYETDKAAFDKEAEAEGVLLDIYYNDGDEAPVLANVAVIGNMGEEPEAVHPPEQSIKLSGNVASSPPSATGSPYMKPSEEPVRISPRARAMASRLGININQLTGSGPNGRIIVRDVESYEKDRPDATTVDTGTVINTGNLEYEEKKLSNLRKLIARSMQESLSVSAQLTHHLSADARKLIALRNKVKAEMENGHTLNITLNDMVCYAAIRALKKFPEMNGHFLGENIRIFKKVHLGFAVDTSRGLMVPVLQNADDLSLNELAVRLKETADQCRKGNINPELLQSSAASFTVSNLGNYGVEIFTPVINLPQIAILGVNTIILRPSDLGNGVFGFIPMIGLSLTYDHRAVDGGPASRFMGEIKNQVENFGTET